MAIRRLICGAAQFRVRFRQLFGSSDCFLHYAGAQAVAESEFRIRARSESVQDVLKEERLWRCNEGAPCTPANVSDANFAPKLDSPALPTIRKRPRNRRGGRGGCVRVCFAPPPPPPPQFP